MKKKYIIGSTVLSLVFIASSIFYSKKYDILKENLPKIANLFLSQKDKNKLVTRKEDISKNDANIITPTKDTELSVKDKLIKRANDIISQKNDLAQNYWQDLLGSSEEELKQKYMKIKTEYAELKTESDTLKDKRYKEMQANNDNEASRIFNEEILPVFDKRDLLSRKMMLLALAKTYQKVENPNLTNSFNEETIDN